MADAEREARVKLTTQADLAGAKEFNKELAETEKATQKADAASKESARTTEDLTKKKNTLKDAVKGLALEFPALARVIGFVTNPLTLLTAALGASAQAFLNWKARIEEAGRKQAELEAIDDAIASLDRTMDGFRESGAAFGDGFKTAAEGVAALNNELERNRQLQDQLGDKGLALTRARIRERVARGQLTPVQGLELEIAAEDQLRREQAAREVSTREAQVSNLRGALGQVPDLGPEELARLKHEADRQAALAGLSQSEFGKFSATQRDRIAALAAERAAAAQTGFRDPISALRAGRAPKGVLEALLTKDETVGDIDTELAAAEAALERERAANEDRQRQADAARRRFEGAQQSVTQRRALTGQLREAESGLGARRSFLQRAGDIDREIGQANLGAERGRTEREEAQRAARARRQEEAKLNQALTAELQARGTVEMVDTLLQLQQQVTTSTNEVLRSHRQKLEQLQRQILDQRSD